MAKALILLVLLALNSSCQQELTTIEKDQNLVENLEITWELVSNQVAEQPQYRSTFVIKNNSDAILSDSGWAIFFNQENRNVITNSVTAPIEFTHHGGDFHQLSPKAGFQLLPKNEITIQSDSRGWIIKEQQAPDGIYVVFYHDNGEERSRFAINNFTIKPFTRPEQINRFIYDQTPNPTSEWQYEQNIQLTKLNRSEIPTIVPTPISAIFEKDSISIDNTFTIHYGDGLEQEAAFLTDRLKILLGGVTLSDMESTEPGNKIILLKIDKELTSSESYNLKIIKGESISIQGSDNSGVFYGIQSLLSLFPIENYKGNSVKATVPTVIIKDAPRFAYRGMHLDVSRNFNKKESVFKLIDVMAFYKLNKLHLHLTDDEGWRLEIKSLPELTEIGAFRGHTLDDVEYLHPSYGSGPEPDSVNSFGSGFYTQQDYMQILKYAFNRHIDVIPEFDLPGHARAAIKAMEARYLNLEKKQDQASEQFRLVDPDDASVYYSAQEFNDNVICVCRESTYRFVETVVDEVIALYKKAQVPLETIHIGGDEVPKGAWTKSPLCDNFLKNNPETSGPAGLMDYFLQRTSEIFKDRNITLSGWEEITLDRDEAGNYVIKPPKNDPIYQVYIWDNFTTGNQDIGYKVANAGYPVVLCSVTNFYFELAYNKDPYEVGHYWGGFVNTRKAYEYIPYDVFKSIYATPLGKPYDRDRSFGNMVRLNQKAQNNILGLQGELWSEPIRGPEMLEYFYLPKLLGLSERAWASQPEWAVIEDDEGREAALDNNWNFFANAIGSREMPRMDYLSGGYNYRIPPPGAKVVDGYLHANTEYPGLTIRYSTDGSEPSENSSRYTLPVQLKESIRLRTFNTTGRGSRVVTVSPN